jgi:DNA-directed RNA polymerase subunit RPC12/RpoP
LQICKLQIEETAKDWLCLFNLKYAIRNSPGGSNPTRRSWAMATSEFRCEQCGKLLSVEALEGQVVNCPHCRKRVAVPRGSASLPRPLVPKAEAPPETPVEEMVEEPAADKTMTALMPLVLSVFLHLGVGLIAGFFTIITVQHVKPQADAGPIEVLGDTFSENPVGLKNPGDPGSEDAARQHDRQHEVTGYSHHDSLVTGAMGHTGDMAAVISAGSGGGQAGGGWAQFGPGSGGNGHGPKSGIFGSYGNAHHVVYCIDSSGSMAFASKNGGSVFDVVRGQMLYSISHLAPVQDFHVVMFQEGPVLELPAKHLQPVTPENRTAAAQWLNQVTPHGAGSDPIPALNRAFDVLANADKARKGKQIFLLTDGAFPNNDAVRKCVEQRNKAKDVHVFTYLYGEQEDESVIKLMKDIATQSAGKYKNITE